MEKHIPQNVSNPVLGNWSNKIQYFEDLPKEVWNIRINSYQICKNWLIARNGCLINNEDSQGYQRIVIVLKEMVKLMEEIKTAIQCDQLKKLGIFEKVRAIVVEKLEIELEKVTPVASFSNDLGADSLDTIELVMALEEAFDIEIPDQTTETLLTVQQAIDYISQEIEVAV